MRVPFANWIVFASFSEYFFKNGAFYDFWGTGVMRSFCPAGFAKRNKKCCFQINFEDT